MLRAAPSLILVSLLVLGGAVFLAGVNWGLPSRRADAFLFDSPDQAWSGQKIQEAAGPWTPDLNRASDIDQSPMARGGRAVELNRTAAQKAEIIRRFRLFSEQPDEMVSFMALARMRGGSLDPGMYQYGGLWIYPVGAMLKAASMARLLTLTGDLDYYLDRPEQFGRFYIVARVYSALWGLVGIGAVFSIARRLARGLLLPASAAACFMLMPVVVNAAHEAKPHLAGAVLVLLTILAAMRYVRAGTVRRALVAGLACGAAAGMVLSGAVAGVALAMMVLLRKDTWRRRAAMLLAGGGMALAVFCVSNPFLPINLFRNSSVVKSNLGTLSRSKAVGGPVNLVKAIPNAAGLIAEGASPPVAVAGCCAGMVLIILKWRKRGGPAERPGRTATPAEPTQRALLAMIAVPALVILAQFTLLAADKPGEYGRFAILPDVLLVFLAVTAMDRLVSHAILRFVLVEALVMGVAFFGMCYVAGFLENRTRIDAAWALRELAPATRTPAGATLAVRAEPAPYNLPPVDVTRWRIVLLPETGEIPGNRPDVIVAPADDPRRPSTAPPGYRRLVVSGRWTLSPARISWADKPFEIWVAEE